MQTSRDYEKESDVVTKSEGDGSGCCAGSDASIAASIFLLTCVKNRNRPQLTIERLNDEFVGDLPNCILYRPYQEVV